MKTDVIVLDGVVHEVLPNAMFKVLSEHGNTILAHISGKMRQHKIQILAGDRVTIECSPYDPSKGRVVFRK